MKKILSIFAVLLIASTCAGCKNEAPKPEEEVQTEKNQEKTVLNIKNETSKKLWNIRCDGKSFTYNSSDTLAPSKSYSVDYDRKVEGYIHFDIVWKDAYLTSDFEISSVRSNDLIIVEKDKQKTVIITDNTLVIPEGKQHPVPLISLKPAFLYVKFNTSKETILQDSIRYAGNAVCRWISSDELFIRCEEDADDYINFTAQYTDHGDIIGSIPVKMHTKTSIKKGEIKTVTISDDSEVSTTEGCVCTIKQLNILSRLTIINNSNVQIEKIHFGDKLYDGQLKRGEKYTFAFLGSGRQEGKCQVVINDKIYNVMFKDEPYVHSRENTDFVINDDTEVYYNGNLYTIKNMPAE